MGDEDYWELRARIVALETFTGILLDHSGIDRELVLGAIEKVAKEDRSKVVEIDPEVGAQDRRVRQALQELAASTREALQLADDEFGRR